MSLAGSAKAFHLSAEPSPEKPRVLLAEDQVEMRSMVSSRLKREGYEVIEALDGDDLLRQLQAALLSGRPPQAIVSDVRMPGVSGLEVLARVRRADADTPVVLITAFGDADLHSTAERLGADCVLDKPFDLDELVHVLWSLVES